mgnify:CR=1 FL=1|jgi:type IV pilus assembly protein PilE
MKKNKTQGFTLIEIVIVLAIIGILAAVAIPSYQGSIQKSRRSDAIAAVTAAAAQQERWYFQFSGYSDSVDDIGGDSGSLTSPEGYYEVAVSNNVGAGSCVGGGSVKFNCFTVTATPVAGKTQTADTKCASFALSHTGGRVVLNSGATDNTSECW